MKFTLLCHPFSLPVSRWLVTILFATWFAQPIRLKLIYLDLHDHIYWRWPPAQPCRWAGAPPWPPSAGPCGWRAREQPGRKNIQFYAFCFFSTKTWDAAVAWESQSWLFANWFISNCDQSQASRKSQNGKLFFYCQCVFSVHKMTTSVWLVGLCESIMGFGGIQWKHMVGLGGKQ